MTPPLPPSLQYLQPFIRFLESFPADELNEDIDATLLDDALRLRFAAGNPHETLEADRQLLDHWLQTFDSVAHPAHWIAGYLAILLPEDIDGSIVPAPHEPLDPELEAIVDRIASRANEMLDGLGSNSWAAPNIVMDTPSGWTAQVAPGVTQLTQGASTATLTVINHQFFEMLLQQHSALPENPQPVTFGRNAGFLCDYSDAAMSSITDYLLQVDGGYVRIRVTLDATTDPTTLESCFPSIAVSTA